MSTEAAEKTTAKQQAETQTERNETKEAQQGRNQGTDQKPNRGQGEHGPKKRGQEGGRTMKGRAKDPLKATATGSRSQSGAKGQVALGTKQCKRTRKVKGEETKRRGGRYVIPRVVYSR